MFEFNNSVQGTTGWKQTNKQKGKEMWEEIVYKIERNGLTFCIPKENKERNGDGGEEERWDWESNFYWAHTMCQDLLDIIHAFYFSSHSF